MATRSITEQQRLADQYREERDAAVTKLTVAKASLADEQSLRIIAEKQRNEAQARVRELLREHMKGATDDEIRDLVSGAFRLVPVVVPKRSDAGPDGLIDPFPDVPPTGSAA